MHKLLEVHCLHLLQECENVGAASVVQRLYSLARLQELWPGGRVRQDGQARGIPEFTAVVGARTSCRQLPQGSTSTVVVDNKSDCLLPTFVLLTLTGCSRFCRKRWPCLDWMLWTEPRKKHISGILPREVQFHPVLLWACEQSLYWFFAYISGLVGNWYSRIHEATFVTPPIFSSVQLLCSRQDFFSQPSQHYDIRLFRGIGRE